MSVSGDHCRISLDNSSARPRAALGNAPSNRLFPTGAFPGFLVNLFGFEVLGPLDSYAQCLACKMPALEATASARRTCNVPVTSILAA
jgi:hypothetical protein